jgi:hypothetical protein
MSMSRRDFAAIAASLKKTNADPYVVTAMAFDLGLFNPRFDRDRFLTAAGVCNVCDGRGERALNDPRDPADLVTRECYACAGTGEAPADPSPFTVVGSATYDAATDSLSGVTA